VCLSVRVLGLFGWSQKRGSAPRYGLMPYRKSAVREAENLLAIEDGSRPSSGVFFFLREAGVKPEFGDV